ncbi:MAG: hypothetical protein WEC84_02850 [Candidatus Andersenbacteria bacterium]
MRFRGIFRGLRAKDKGYASVSEYIRYFLRDREERERLRGLRGSQAEIAVGRGKELRSLKDLR